MSLGQESGIVGVEEGGSPPRSRRWGGRAGLGASAGFGRYAGGRVLALVPQLIAVSFVAFMLIRLLPGDPAARLLGPAASPDSIAALRSRLGLDEPLLTQYWLYVKGLAYGDLGQSWYTSEPVASDLARRAPATLELIFYSMLLAGICGITFGVMAAARPRSFLARVNTLYMRIAGALPDFWIGLLAVFVFFHLLGVVPAPIGRLSLEVQAPPRITGAYTIDSVLTGNPSAFGSAVSHLILPVCVLAFVVTPMISRITYVSVRTALEAEFIRYAVALGHRPSMVWRFALRNALPSVITILGVLTAYLLGGAVLIESIFAWGGVGQYAVQAVTNGDYAPVQGVLLLTAVFTALVYLVADLLSRSLDARVRA